MRPIFFLCVFCLFVPLGRVAAQDDLLNEIEKDQAKEKKPAVEGAFATTRIVNQHTNETIGKNVLEFRITHRFGEMSGGGHALFGLDNSSDIRIAFEYGITDYLMVGFGRSKVSENLDLFVKGRVLRQQVKGFPFSLTMLGSFAFSPAANLTNANGIKTFPKFSHRASYIVSAILTKKWRRFSFLLAPTYLHRNYVPQYYFADNKLVTNNNDVFALGVGLRFRATRSLSVLLEYTQVFNNFWNPSRIDANQTIDAFNFYMPLSVGVEMEVGGHVFQINLTNSQSIIPNEYVAYSPSDWLKGGMRLGFTISRVFTPGKRIVKRKGETETPKTDPKPEN